MSTAPALQPELTDEEVQKLLAGESARGPRAFKGRELAPLTMGAKDLIYKVVSPGDTMILHDTVLLFILAELHTADPAEKLAKRTVLMAATDDPAQFRARVSIEMLDDLTPEEIAEARRLVNEILSPVNLAQVTIAQTSAVKKKSGEAKPSRTKTRS